MKIIEQHYEILSLPENLLETLEKAGRTCYKSEDRIGCTIKKGEKEPDSAYDHCTAEFDNDDNVIDGCTAECPFHSSHKFIGMLRDRGHHAMIEFGDIIVRFVTNRGVTHEIVRHRLSSFAQESTRYVRYDGEMEFIRPVWCGDEVVGVFNEPYDFDRVEDSVDNAFLNFLWDSEKAYKHLLVDNGWQAQQAREVLPNALKTEIVWKANIREWRHIFSLRCSKAAHPQMRALMIPLMNELKRTLPVVFDDIHQAA